MHSFMHTYKLIAYGKIRRWENAKQFEMKEVEKYKNDEELDIHIWIYHFSSAHLFFCYSASLKERLFPLAEFT